MMEFCCKLKKKMMAESESESDRFCPTSIFDSNSFYQKTLRIHDSESDSAVLVTLKNKVLIKSAV